MKVFIIFKTISLLLFNWIYETNSIITINFLIKSLIYWNELNTEQKFIWFSISLNIYYLILKWEKQTE
jgi:hypothetical protein